MKRAIAKIIMCVILLSLLISGCKKKTEQSKDVIDIRIESAEDVLVKVWACYGENDKFNIVGGDMDNMAMGCPCDFSLTAVSEMENMLGVPESTVSMLENAATMADEMDSYIYTVAAYCVKDSSNVTKFRETVEENLLNKEWGETIPDKLVVATLDSDYVIVAYGTEDKMDTFVDRLEYATDAKVIVNKNWK